MAVSIIVACDPRGVIGKGNKLPWRIPEDLKLFRERTLDHAIIMGRKTWDSLPIKPLDKRANIVVTRSVFMAPKDKDLGPFYCGSLSGAIEFVGKLNAYKDKEIFIIGGAQVYKEALDADLVDKIIMSKTVDNHDGDVYFPELDKDKWKVLGTEIRKGFDVIYMVKKDRLS
jgi:dihydrofolate reductase